VLAVGTSVLTVSHRDTPGNRAESRNFLFVGGLERLALLHRGIPMKRLRPRLQRGERVRCRYLMKGNGRGVSKAGTESDVDAVVTQPGQGIDLGSVEKNLEVQMRTISTRTRANTASIANLGNKLTRNYALAR